LSESNFRPTFSVIDVSYDGYIAVSSDDKPMDYEDLSDGYTSRGSETRTESEIMAPSSTLATLPIFVIGFSGTIVLCGLIMLFSEFRQRRQFDKDVIMLIQSLPENSSSRRSSESSSLSTDHRNLKSTLCSIFGDMYTGADDSGPRRGKEEHYFPTVQVCVYDGSNNSLSLCYDGYHPEYYYCAEAAVGGGNKQYYNHRFERSGQPFLCNQNTHRNREVMFYRSEESSFSVASTITRSLPLDHQTRNLRTNDVLDSPAQSNDCKIMELTEIHRVSTGIALESLVELGAISATHAAISSVAPSLYSHCSTIPLEAVIARDRPMAVNIGYKGNNSKSDDDDDDDDGGSGGGGDDDDGGGGGGDNVDDDDDGSDDVTDNDPLSSMPFQLLSASGFSNERKCSVSAFDAGTPPIAEVMTNEDCLCNDDDNDFEEMGLLEKATAEEEDESSRMNGCGDRKSEESYFVDTADATVAATATTATTFSSSASSENTVPRATISLYSIDSFEIESNEKVEESKAPSSVLLLGEGSLVAVAQRNGYTRLENTYRTIRVEEESTDSSTAGNDDDICERREYDKDIDFSVRSLPSSSSSMDASTMTNSRNTQEHLVFPEERNGESDFNNRIDMIDKSNMLATVPKVWI
jgi:hypothetical protein